MHYETFDEPCDDADSRSQELARDLLAVVNGFDALSKLTYELNVTACEFDAQAASVETFAQFDLTLPLNREPLVSGVWHLRNEFCEAVDVLSPIVRQALGRECLAQRARCTLH